VEPTLTDEERHKRYVTRRRRWARSVGFPFKGHELEPDVGALDCPPDPENG
jgi:hypothetical protein